MVGLVKLTTGNSQLEKTKPKESNKRLINTVGGKPFDKGLFRQKLSQSVKTTKTQSNIRKAPKPV